MSPLGGMIVARAIFYISVIPLFGGALVESCLVRGDLARQIGRHLRKPLIGAAAAGVIATLGWLPAETAIAGGGWASALDPDLLRVLALQTSIGQVFLATLGLSLLTLLASLSSAVPGQLRLGLAGALLLARAFAGHAVMSGGGALGWLHVAADGLHILSAAAWVGSLVPLSLGLRIAEPGDPQREARHFVRRFSIMAQTSVALVLLTGIANTWLILGGWPVHWSHSYQVLLSAKIALVFAMLCIAWFNRCILTPRFNRGAPYSARSLLGSVAFEIGLSAGVLVLVAILGELPPD